MGYIVLLSYSIFLLEYILFIYEYLDDVPKFMANNRPEWWWTTRLSSPPILIQVSSVENPGWLFDIGDDELPNYMGIIS